MPHKTPEARAAYREAHREEHRLYSVAYRARHREEVNARRRAYKLEHPEKTSEWSRNYHLRHRDQRNKKSRVYNHKRFQFFMAVLDAERAGGCVDCGEKDVRVLAFDHVRGVKLFNVSQARHFPIRAVYTEIDKCEVRCANCHLRVTANRRAMKGATSAVA